MKNTCNLLFYNFLFIISLAAFQSCAKSPDYNPSKNSGNIKINNENIPSDLNPEKKLVYISNNLGLTLFRNLNQYLEDENILISPASLSVSCGLLYNGIGGDSRKNIGSVMGYKNYTINNLNEQYDQFQKRIINSGKGNNFDIINSVWYSNNYSISENFLQTCQNYYNTPVLSVNFRNANIISTINSWGVQQSKSNLSSIINQVDPDEVFVNLTAAYFSGFWKNRFDEKRTHTEAFYNSGTEYQTTFMLLSDTFIYESTDLYEALELPFVNDSLMMVCFLPQLSVNINDFIADLTIQNWTDWMNRLKDSVTLEVMLPKFKYVFQERLNTFLVNIGLNALIDRTNSDFSNMTNDSTFYLSNFQNNIAIDINENGLNSLELTDTLSTSDGYLNSKILHLYFNRPFTYAIIEKSKGTILFLGKISKPVIGNW